LTETGTTETGTMRGSKYKCKHCGKVVVRASNKQWVKSYCDKTGKVVHLTRVTS